MSRLLPTGIAGVLLALVAAPLAGQGSDCTIIEARETRRLVGANGAPMYFVRGPLEIHCRGGIVVRADSAHSTGTGELRLVRDVYYQDSTQIMTSVTANYFRDEGRLIARGDVVVRDRFGPSVVRGAELQYDKVMPDRPETRIVVRGRPRAYLYESGTPPLPPGMEPSPGMRIVGGDTIPAALQVDADRLELGGENRILAHGGVQMIRENLRAFADEADYDRGAGRMDLTGSARIEGEGYELFGDRITATLPNQALERVLSDGNAMLVGEELRVRAPVIDIALAAGEVERMIAVSRDPAVRANAIARDFSLAADSIQADAPGSAIERITAVGNAYGEREADSASAALPELVRSDWLRGDTIVGTFVTLEAGALSADPAGAASDTARAVLETLTASGNARSLYRMESTDSDADRPAVNYMTASRIALRFRDGEVADVDAEGPVEGVHLEPVRTSNADDAEPTDDAGAAAERGIAEREPSR